MPFLSLQALHVATHCSIGVVAPEIGEADCLVVPAGGGFFDLIARCR